MNWQGFFAGVSIGLVVSTLFWSAVNSRGWAKHNVRYHSHEWQQCAAPRGTWECPRQPQGDGE